MEIYINSTTFLEVLILCGDWLNEISKCSLLYLRLMFGLAE